MLDATVTLLAAGGLNAVTVAAVAREAGTSNGSLYHRFGDRAGLLRAAQERSLKGIEDETLAAFAEADAETDDATAVRLLAAAAMGMFVRHRAVLKAFLLDPGDDTPVRERTMRSRKLLADTVTGWLQDRFAMPEPDAEAAYRIIFSLGVTQALFTDADVHDRGVTPEHLADALARAVVALLPR